MSVLSLARRAALLALAGAPLAAAAAQDAPEGFVPAFAAEAAPASLAPLTFMSAPALLDLDGNGSLDAVVGRADGTLISLLNGAAPAAAPVYTLRTAGTAGVPVSVSFAAVPAAGDIDGDGRVDLVVGGGDGQLRVLLNGAAAGSASAFGAATLGAYGLADVGDNAAPTLGDVDGDGDTDVLAGRTDGTVAWFENTAGPQATPVMVLRTGAANPLGTLDVGFSSAPHLADVDADGDLDVLVGNVDGEIRLLTNTAGPRATPVFAAPVTGPVGLADVGFGSVLTAADVDNDGDVDLLAGTSGGPARLYRNGGTDGTRTASLTGTTGYRLLAAPSATSTLAELLGTTIYTQGFPGALAPTGASTVYRYSEATPGAASLGYAAPGNLSDAVGLGRGLYVYVFADEDPRPPAPGQQGGFPKTLRATGRPALVTFSWGTAGSAPLTYTSTGAPADDGWNLLGNPFGASFDWDGTSASGTDAAVYVYDNVSANYLTHSRGIPGAGSLPGGIVGPFQGFWVKATAASPTLTARPGVSSGGPVYRGTAPAVIGLRLRPAEGSPLPAGLASEVYLAFGVDGATVGVDPLDAVALLPPASDFVLLSTTALREDGTPAALAIDARPALGAPVTVGLSTSLVAAGAEAGGALVLDWPALALPDGWTVTLIDRADDRRVALAAGGRYAFTLAGAPAAPPLAPTLDVAAPSLATLRLDGRFALVVSPDGATTAGEATPAALGLSAPFPNPTTGEARMRLALPAAAHVTVAAYDALGRRVATLADADLGAGTHDVLVPAGRLAAGVYVLRAEVAGADQSAALSHRLTIVP